MGLRRQETGERSVSELEIVEAASGLRRIPAGLSACVRDDQQSDADALQEELHDGGIIADLEGDSASACRLRC